MKLGFGILLAMCAVAEAADAPAQPQAVATAKPAQAPTTPETRAPLDLRIRDIREYMTPEQFQAAVTARDVERDTIVVQGTRLLPMESMKPIPGGLASLWYAAKNPLQSWRILAPVVNAPEYKNENKVPPPIFRWGP